MIRIRAAVALAMALLFAVQPAIADTTTTNLGLTKPAIGADDSTWGTLFNANLDLVDAEYARTSRGDANYTILSADRYIALTASLTAPRTFTLPAASSRKTGQPIVFLDEAGGVSGTNTLTFARAGADTISGATSLVLSSANQVVVLRSDGTSKWTVLGTACLLNTSCTWSAFQLFKLGTTGTTVFPVRLQNPANTIAANGVGIDFDATGNGMGIRDSQIYALQNPGDNGSSLHFATNAAGSSPTDALVLTSLGLTRILGQAQLAASTTSWASVNIAPGVAPTSPSNGDLWTTSAGIFARVNGRSSRLNGPTPPQGRLTLTSGTPVTTADVNSAGTVYYTPYVGQLVPIYDGSAFVMTDTGGELSILLDSTNHLSDKNFDLFVINNAGTIRVCTGPAWSSNTSRGSGAGTTQLQLLNGIYTNAVSLTCRYSSSSTVVVSANQATYVGTFRTIAGGLTMDSHFERMTWNAYNRRLRYLNYTESTASWTDASTSFVPQSAAAPSLYAVQGLAEDAVSLEVTAMAHNTTANIETYVGIGIDSASVDSSVTNIPVVTGTASNAPARAIYLGIPALGYHQYSWLEKVVSGTGSYVGTGTNGAKSGMTAQVWG